MGERGGGGGGMHPQVLITYMVSGAIREICVMCSATHVHTMTNSLVNERGSSCDLFRHGIQCFTSRCP